MLREPELDRAKAQRSGFGEEEEEAGSETKSFVRSGTLKTKDGVQRAASDEVKLKRAQGECLGIRSRRRT